MAVLKDESDELGHWHLDASGIAEYVEQKWDLPIRPAACQRLLNIGRGPVSRHAYAPFRAASTKDVDRWAQHCLVDPVFEYASGGLLDPSLPKNRDQPQWLLVSSQPHYDWLGSALVGWGCEIHASAMNPRSAIRYAAGADVDAAILDMDWNIEAAIIAADHLCARNVPFIFVSELWELPSLFVSPGHVFRRRNSIARLGHFVRMYMPPELVTRMNRGECSSAKALSRLPDQRVRLV